MTALCKDAPGLARQMYEANARSKGVEPIPFDSLTDHQFRDWERRAERVLRERA